MAAIKISMVMNIYVCVCACVRVLSGLFVMYILWHTTQTEKLSNTHSQHTAEYGKGVRFDHSRSIYKLFLAFPHVPLSKTLNHLAARTAVQQFWSALKHAQIFIWGEKCFWNRFSVIMLAAFPLMGEKSDENGANVKEV